MEVSSNPHASGISATTTPEAITQIKKILSVLDAMFGCCQLDCPQT